MTQYEHLEVAAQAQQEGAQLVSNGDYESRVDYSRLRDPREGLRVNKWDAQILDGEIMALLKTPFQSIFAMFDPSVVDSIKPEIDAMLGVLLFVFTTGIRRPTPGMKLENVQFPPEALSNKKISALFLLSVGLPYAWKRAFRHFSLARWRGANTTDAPGDSEDRSSSILRLMKRVETLVIACQLANLLVFLHKGTYRSLAERVLRLKLRSSVPTVTPRIINFEYMTRQLLWDGLMEFGTFVLPFLTWSQSRLPAAIASSSADAGPRSIAQCSLCGLTPPQTPYITSCKHLYCYFCVQTAVAVDDDFACVVCGSKFDSSQRLGA